jgi:exosome complex RNA-binding protein Csl4
VSKLAYYRHQEGTYNDDDELKAYEIGVYLNDDNTVNISLATFNTLMAQGATRT